MHAKCVGLSEGPQSFEDASGKDYCVIDDDFNIAGEIFLVRAGLTILRH